MDATRTKRNRYILQHIVLNLLMSYCRLGKAHCRGDLPKVQTLNCCSDVNDGSTDWLRFRWSAARRSVESEMLLDMALEDWSVPEFLEGSPSAVPTAAVPGTSWRDCGCDVGVWTGVEGIGRPPRPPPIWRWWKAPLCGWPLGGGAREKWCSTGTGLRAGSLRSGRPSMVEVHVHIHRGCQVTIYIRLVVHWLYYKLLNKG